MECSCNTHIKYDDDNEQEIERLIEKSILRCLKTWIIFWFNKFSQCTKGQRTASAKRSFDDLDETTTHVHTNLRLLFVRLSDRVGAVRYWPLGRATYRYLYYLYLPDNFVIGVINLCK